MKTKLMNRKNIEVALSCLSAMAIYSRVFEISESGILETICGIAMGLATQYASKAVSGLEHRDNRDDARSRRCRHSIYSRQGYRYSLELNNKTDAVAQPSVQKPLRIVTGTPSFDIGDKSGVTVHDILGI